MSNRDEWEFWTGDDWIKGQVEQAKPIISWENHTGVVTMSYQPVLKKYITIISTASFYPSMRKQFDTYFLESDSITGPYRYISYLSEFGPEAYFVNIPSKFATTQIVRNETSKSSYYGAFLSYSANFAFVQDPPNPPGSGYHWSLQQFRFVLAQKY